MTLAPHIAALKMDVGSARPSSGTRLRLDCAASVLGALYVAHGAGFGAKIIQKSSVTNLLNARANFYFIDGAFARPLVCEALETLDGAGVEIAVCAANSIFDILDRISKETV